MPLNVGVRLRSIRIDENVTVAADRAAYLAQRVPNVFVDEPTLISAIEKSGYPLQGVVAEKLIAARFNVSQE